MGTITHHAIIVTSWHDEELEAAHEEAKSCGLSVSPISDLATNDYRSFAAWPDGSKEGWVGSDDGDARRGSFIAYLHRRRYSDGSSPLAWCEVAYGEQVWGNGRDGARVTRHCWQVKVSDKYRGPAEAED